MHVHELALTGFRTYAGLVATFPGGPQVVAGPNAAGKTNLVEAIALLALGRSHRTRADQELIRWGDDFARVQAGIGRAVAGGAAPDRIEVLIAGPGSGRAGKRVRINGVPRRIDALSGALRAVIFSPESMLLVVGSPALRREELDTLAGQLRPGHARHLATYGRALAQRNSLLRAIREGEAGRDELGYWDSVLVEEGGAIVAGRLDTLDAAAAPLEAAHAEIAPGEAGLTLRYVTNAQAAAGETPRDALRRRLEETAEKELWNGVTLVGPHRDDLVFEQDGRDMASFGSRGQQRTAILALKLVELDILSAADGTAPLLLLDDVFSELDPDRRSHLVRRIQALPQAFITTTALDDLDPRLVAESTAWRVSPGQLVRAGT